MLCLEYVALADFMCHAFACLAGEGYRGLRQVFVVVFVDVCPALLFR